MVENKMVELEELSLDDLQMLYGMAKRLDLEKINFCKTLANGRNRSTSKLVSQLPNFLPVVELWEAIDRDLSISRVKELHEAIDIFHIDYSKLLINNVTDKGFGKLGVNKKNLVFYYFDGTKESYENIREIVLNRVNKLGHKQNRVEIEKARYYSSEDETFFMKITDKTRKILNYKGDNYEYSTTAVAPNQYLVVDYSETHFHNYADGWLNGSIYELLEDNAFSVPFVEYKETYNTPALMLKDEVLRDFKRKDESLEVNND